MAEAAGALNLGTLTVQLAADVSRLQKEFNKAFKETEKLAAEAHSLRASFDRAFGGVATAATRVAGNLNQVSESIGKVFGENGIPQARAFAESMGLSEGKIKGLQTSLKGLSGIFSGVAMAAGLLSAPVLAAVAAIAGLILLVGALKIAWDENLFGIKDAAKAAWEFVTDALTTAAEFWIDVFNDVKNAILSAFSAVLSYAAKAADAMSPVIGDGAANWLKSASASIAPDKSKSGKEVLAGLKAGAPGLIEDIKDVAVDGLMNAFDGVKQSWNAFGGPLLKDLMASLMDAIPEVEKQTKGKALDAYDDAEEKRLDKLQKAFEKIQKEEEAIRRKEVEAREKAAREYAEALQREAEARKQALDSMYGNIGGGRVGSAMSNYNRSQGGSGSYGLGNYALDQLGSAAAGGKYTSSTLQGAAGGAQAGGGWGAVVGAVLGLLTQSEGFAKALESLESVLKPISDALGKLAEPFADVFDAVGSVLDPILSIVSELLTFGPYLRAFGQDLTPVIKLLKPIGNILSAFLPVLQLVTDIAGKLDINMRVLAVVFNSIANVLKLLESAVNWVVYGIQSAYNWIVDVIADALDFIGADDTAKNLRNSKADAEGTRQKAIQAWNDFTSSWTLDGLTSWGDGADRGLTDPYDPLKDLGDAAGDAAYSMREFSDALTNLPSGYKIALARFNAAAPLGGTAGGGETNITINVNGGDASETWKQIKKHMRRDGFLESGSSVATAPAFSAA